MPNAPVFMILQDYKAGLHDKLRIEIGISSGRDKIGYVAEKTTHSHFLPGMSPYRIEPPEAKEKKIDLPEH